MMRRVALAERVIGCSTTGRAALLAMSCPPSRRWSVGEFWLGVFVGLCVCAVAVAMGMVAR
jgi:hypothetical protein